MTSGQVYESLVSEVGSLGREAMIARLVNFEGPLRLDFTEEFLAGKSTEEIRHLLMAALWRSRVREG
jgi:hypothetical protein